MKPVDQARNALAFLEDETHEHTFDTLIWAVRQRRDAAAREVPEWEDLRTLASQIKEHTLSHLAGYLEQFEQRATANGARVHWARDAHEHNQIVSDILASHGAKTLVKSKSMLTEECEMRPFLKRRGITVTETDLGERIQQLDDQPPAHIVGPAFQKTTKDIAEEFHRVYAQWSALRWASPRPGRSCSRSPSSPSPPPPCWPSTWWCCSIPPTSWRTSTWPTGIPASPTPRTRCCCPGRPGQPTSAA
jgi:L-lactate utilization protein LutB